MYITVTEVRQRLMVLGASDVTDADIQRFIIDAESYLNLCLADFYTVPVRKTVNNTGTISLTADSTTITGTDTSFKTDLELQAFDHIRVNKTNEVLLIASITDDTTAVSAENVVNETTDSTFFIIPEEICTVARYLTVKLILDWKFSESAFNQDSNNLVKRTEDLAKKILKKIETGTYYNADLEAQTSAKNKARSIGIYTGDQQTNSLAVQSEYNSWWN